MKKESFIKTPQKLLSDQRLTLDEKGFLLWLFNNNESKWKVSYRQLTRDLKLSLRTIQNYVRKLKELGYLLIYRDSKFSSIWIVMLIPFAKDDLELKKRGFIKVFGSKEKAEKYKQLDIFEEGENNNND